MGSRGGAPAARWCLVVAVGAMVSACGSEPLPISEPHRYDGERRDAKRDNGHAVRDRDSDGITDAYDQCPETPEDRDGDRDADGCPESPSVSDTPRTPPAKTETAEMDDEPRMEVPGSYSMTLDGVMATAVFDDPLFPKEIRAVDEAVAKTMSMLHGAGLYALGLEETGSLVAIMSIEIPAGGRARIEPLEVEPKELEKRFISGINAAETDLSEPLKHPVRTRFRLEVVKPPP